jgi:hypothetical protein
MAKSKAQYEFVSFNNHLVSGDGKYCIKVYVEAINMGDFVQHQHVPGKELVVNDQGWSYGLPPRYHDGRVTTRRTAWVYGKKVAGVEGHPEAVALVYFTANKGEPDEAPLGYLKRVK